VTEPTREEVDTWTGRVVLEFGTSTCSYCAAAQPLIASALAEHPGVRHVKIEDGTGRPLGRSFHVRLWPTLVMLVDGKEVARAVRPRSEIPLGRAFDALGT
jgi:thioredoxin 1